MIICTEHTVIDQEHIWYKYLALGLIILSFAYEAYNSFLYGRISLLGWGYSFLFLLMWGWRIGFTYTYTLTETQLVVKKEGFGFVKELSIELSQVESFTNCYVRSFFRKTKISRYAHSYSSTDPRPQRLLVYRQEGRLEAVIFKVSDEFLAHLKESLPDKYLDFKL